MTMKATLTTPQAAEEILEEATSTGRLRIVHTDAIFDHEGCSWSGVDVGGSGGFAIGALLCLNFPRTILLVSA
jgi:hypothetical protein